MIIQAQEVTAGIDQLTDPLTGFGTRLKLIAELSAAINPASPARTLALFDLGGLRDYVELYGRLEGDALLVRLAGRLSEELGQRASYYRPREDELAALVDAPPAGAEPFLTAAAEALTARFGQFKITLTFGAALVPDEADGPIEAMMLADARLSSHARDRRARERRRTPRTDA